MKRIRQLHLYLGTFFAPAIIFFALTGALQTFGLHENPKGSTEKRPAWIAKLAEVHKEQHLPRPRPERGTAEPALRPQPGKASKTPQEAEETALPSPLPLKIFVLFMSIGLISTTLLGIYMAFKYNRDRRVIWGLLFAGTVLPIALLYL